MLVDRIKDALNMPRDDGMLHFSQHLQHDRHTAIYMKHGYPIVDQPWGRMFPLVQGTGIHETIHMLMPDICDAYLPEHKITVTDGLKYTWTGSVDAFAKYQDSYWLLDYKTISGAGMMFLGDEPKDEHRWQVSAYHAFRPESDQTWRTAILYFPSSPDYKRNWEEPRMIEFTPYPKEVMLERMREVEEAIDAYKEDGSLPAFLPPTWKWKKRGQTWHLEQRPHFTSLFCPWGSLHDDPCGCSAQEVVIIAKWKAGKLKVEPAYAIIAEKVIETIGEPDED